MAAASVTPDVCNVLQMSSGGPEARGELLRHIMQEMVAPGGRLVVGPQRHAECAAVLDAIKEARLEPVGEKVDGVRRVYWIEKPA